tara:strand:- start:352 stop:633 length:282 start_codon:yes stop_codon:yes gene_type:complete
MIELIWTKHAVQRGHTRLGRYGMDNIQKKILKNINRATLNNKGDEAMIPFKLGKNKCLAVLIPVGKTGSKAVIKSIYPIDDKKYHAIFKKRGR